MLSISLNGLPPDDIDAVRPRPINQSVFDPPVERSG
jgi:hypothetical protein